MNRSAICFAFTGTIAVIALLSASGFAGTSYFDVDREFYPYYPSLVK